MQICSRLVWTFKSFLTSSVLTEASHIVRKGACYSSKAMSSTGDSAKPTNVIFFLGAPGSGKGTQCHLLSQKRGYPHLSAGELIRAERDAVGSQYGAAIQEDIKTPGTFVRSPITCALIERAMKNQTKNEESSFLIDGFPINSENLSVWNSCMTGKAVVRCVVFLDISEDLSVKRCLGRGRRDDTEEILRIRFREFERQTMPVVEHYREQGILQTVSGMQEPEQVLEDILKVLPA